VFRYLSVAAIGRPKAFGLGRLPTAFSGVPQIFAAVMQKVEWRRLEESWPNAGWVYSCAMLA
jgi:hypothetical protein